MRSNLAPSSLFCMTRKSGETATKPIAYHLSQGEFDGSKIVSGSLQSYLLFLWCWKTKKKQEIFRKSSYFQRFVPATYSVIVPNMRILASAMCDFASMTFPDFGKLSALNRVRSCTDLDWFRINSLSFLAFIAASIKCYICSGFLRCNYIFRVGALRTRSDKWP